MARRILLSFAATAIFAALCVINNTATKRVFSSQPEWYFLNLHSYKKIGHILGTGFGFRSLIADFEYINFLQYYGNWENRKTGYKDLYKYLDDITDADPHFTFAYTYGSAILAFNLEKYDEAARFMEKGLKYNPKNWKLRMYMGAIIYRQKGDMANYISFLEDALQYDDHPALIERLLGNIYEVTKTPDFAARYWVKIIKKSGDKKTREHAAARIIRLIKQGGIKEPGELLKQINNRTDQYNWLNQ